LLLERDDGLLTINAYEHRHYYVVGGALCLSAVNDFWQRLEKKVSLHWFNV